MDVAKYTYFVNLKAASYMIVHVFSSKLDKRVKHWDIPETFAIFPFHNNSFSNERSNFVW